MEYDDGDCWVVILGLGAEPPLAEWGLMVSQGRSFMQTAPWVVIAPGLAIFITVLCV